MKKAFLWFFLVVIFNALPAQNSFDHTFGDNGIVTTNFGGQVKGGQVSRQSNGKLLLGGPVQDSVDHSFFSLIRYLPDGSVDETFADSGVLTHGVSYNGIFFVQPDDKILIADQDYMGFRISRFLPDGSPDYSFGNLGEAVFYDDDLWSVWIYSLAVQPDGKILAAGGANDVYEENSRFFIARLDPSGSPDSTFGQHGMVLKNGQEEWFRIKSIQVQPDGKILVSTSIPLSMNGAIVRLNEDGNIDSGFGTNGIATTGQNEGFPGESVLLQPDGKIILYDIKNLTRFDPDGMLDTLFGNGGLVPLDYASGGNMPLRTASLIDDKILVAFTLLNPDSDFGIWRFNTDGTPDESFGINGRVEIDIWTNDRPQSILGLPQGKIAVAGVSDSKFSLVSLLPNGEPDPDFGDNGTILVYYGGAWSAIMGMGLQFDGKPVAVGRADEGDIVLARYLDDGTLDPAFGVNGKAVTDLKSHHLSPRAMIVLPGDKIAVAGKVGLKDFFVFRYLPDGSPDPDFGENGLLILPVGVISSNCNAFAIQPDGKFLMGGILNTNFAIARFLPDGAPDEQFGDHGWIIFPSVYSNYAQDLQLQPDGKILAAGQTPDGFNLFRFLPDGSPDYSFNFFGEALSGLDRINAIRVLPDGKILAAGHHNYDLGMVRFLPNGAIDPDFLFSNYYSSFPSQYGEIEDIALQPGGKILFTGNGLEYPDFFIGRTFPDGSLDSSFFEKGLVEFPYLGSGIHTSVRSILVQPDGKTLIGGSKSNWDFLNVPIDADFLLVRIPEDPFVGVSDPGVPLRDISLAPNLVGSQATISYTLLHSQTVSILLHDASGKPVCTFVDQEHRPAGQNREVLFFPEDLARGMYFLTVRPERGKKSVRVVRY
ncbi:MAG: hypothetical protein H6563_02380 [Lewinellaceae bacterium]|nr:hypothetical protein [Lewinellaceae bacterium]